MLKIVRGASDVAKARGNRRRISKSSTDDGRSLMPGQIGVTVRREGNLPDVPISISAHDDESQNESLEAGGDGGTLGPKDATLPQSNPFQLPEGSPIDLAANSPEPVARASSCASASANLRPPCANNGGGQSLGPWLSSVPTQKTITAAAKGTGTGKDGNKRRRQAAEASARGKGKRTERAWAGTTLSHATSGGAMAGGRLGGGDGSLSAWLEPRTSQPAPSTSHKKKRGTPRKGEGAMDAAAAVAGYGFDGNGDGDGDGGDEDGVWMSNRLEGLDPTGAARAKDSWTDRERRNLTSTDVALGAKRKGKGCGGGSRTWRVLKGVARKKRKS